MRMRTRTDKIEEIENLINKNKFSRRKFIDSLGKTVALSSIAAIGLTSCSSLELDDKEKDCLALMEFCISHSCKAVGQGFACPIPFKCIGTNICTPIRCKNGIDDYNCTGSVVSHKGGSTNPQ